MSQNDAIERLVGLLQDKTASDIRKAKQDAVKTAVSVPIILRAPTGSTGDTVLLEGQNVAGETTFRLYADGRMEICRVGERCEAIWDSAGDYLVDSEGNYLATL